MTDLGEWLLQPDEAALITTLRQVIGRPTRLWDEAQSEKDTGADFPPLEGKSGDAYEACAEGLATAATAAFDLVAKALGVTGFQASWAVMQFVRRENNIEGPFGLWKGEEWLYPQYNMIRDIEGYRRDPETVKWLGDQAEAKIGAVSDGGTVHPNVLSHWRTLVAERNELVDGPA